MIQVASNYFKGLWHNIVVVMLYTFIYLPILVLVLFSFNESEVSMSWTSFSLRWYYLLWNTPELLDSLKVSFIVASASTFSALFLGVCFVIGSSCWKTDHVYSLFYLNIILPDIVLGIGLLTIFNFLHLPLGYGSLIVGHTLLGLGFAIPIIRARYLELDPVLTEASLDLGATYIQTMMKVIFPLLIPSLLAAGLIIFTLSLDDFMISFFCSGPTLQTLSVYVFSMIRTGIDPSINALSTVILVMSSLLILLLSYSKLINRVVSHE
ncbi:ABC transporter permease [Candidatus Babeliales bacterium]|nr:ABC transporter permease [Candidatus Babeliales bacterium]